MSPTAGTLETGRETYTLRQYRPGDAEEFCSLYETVWDRSHDGDWFDWKYRRNPAADRVTMFVAETDGDLVATCPFVPMRMATPRGSVLALQATDTMVHPDHRRRGLFTTLTERAIEHHTEGEASFVFSRPNERSAPGYRDLGWRMIDPTRKYFRVQDPARLADDRVRGLRGELFGRLAAVGGAGYLALREALATPPAGYAVRRHEGVRAPTLAALYERNVPDALHAIRDEAFYRWRFANPTRTAATYVAERDGTPVAGVVARTGRNHNDVLVTQIADVAPLAGGDDWEAAVAALLDRIVADYGESAALATTATLPPAVLGRHGFLPDDVPPLSLLRQQSYDLAVRPLGTSGEWTVGGLSLLSATNWTLTHAEREN